ncbi:uncharacterized protein LOC103519857 isoform X2 [Diaphorina citri]|uniref:Uncharacterized protein LOC103519857 isoform X2 n=1 Tax=Diaphorina citri TaxID=121845 RepID=A0A3Q0JF73_DIACI|nr:uncharacterized protein LOC103519857 isoform X2 [Diaphorina citri]
MNTTYMLNKLMHPSSDSSSNSDNSYKPCTDYEVEELWHYTLPKIKSETPVRSVDVNGDGIEDVIIGYGTECAFHYHFASFSVLLVLIRQIYPCTLVKCTLVSQGLVLEGCLLWMARLEHSSGRSG